MANINEHPKTVVVGLDVTQLNATIDLGGTIPGEPEKPKTYSVEATCYNCSDFVDGARYGQTFDIPCGISKRDFFIYHVGVCDHCGCSTQWGSGEVWRRLRPISNEVRQHLTEDLLTIRQALHGHKRSFWGWTKGKKL